VKPRDPQLSLRLDSAPSHSAGRWRDRASLPYLGAHLVLQLDTDRTAAVLDGDILHLPLPPAATPRQIQDGVEAWLRREATRLIDGGVQRQAQRLGLPRPRWALSFSARGGWVAQHADGSLRFNWRLIEQPAGVIDQVVGQALAALPRQHATADFWEMQAV
jgi:hypothetical protein